jgi:hypothetical protein
MCVRDGAEMAPSLYIEQCGNELSDFLLYSELIELHRRKTEAELKGFSPKAYDAVIAFYKLELLKSAKEEPDRDARNSSP